MSTTGSIFLSLMFYKYKNILLQEQVNNIVYNNISKTSDIIDDDISDKHSVRIIRVKSRRGDDSMSPRP
jgi:hypothetical protein